MTAPDDELQRQAEALHERICSAAQTTASSRWLVGELLIEMRDKRLFASFGFHSWKEYLLQNKQLIGRRLAYDYMLLVDKFGIVQHAAQTEKDQAAIRGKLIAADTTKLVSLARLIQPGDNPRSIMGLVEQSAILSRPGLRVSVNAELERRQQAGADYILPTYLTIPSAPESAPSSEGQPLADAQEDAEEHDFEPRPARDTPPVKADEMTELAQSEAFAETTAMPSTVELSGLPGARTQTTFMALMPFPHAEIRALTLALTSPLPPKMGERARTLAELDALTDAITRWRDSLQRS